MASIRIEPAPKIKRETCPACGGQGYMLLGFVYSDGTPHGIYYVDWCEADHPEREAFVTVSTGNYADADATADRVAFGLDMACEGFGLADAPLRERPYLGEFVPREVALGRDDIGDVWQICDHLVNDTRVAAVTAWLCGRAETALAADDLAIDS